MRSNNGQKATSEKFMYPNNGNNNTQYELNKRENVNHIRNGNYNFIGKNNFRGYEGNKQQGKNFGYNKNGGLFKYKNNPSNNQGGFY